jgi:tetratricopeptide (TPR) repeat protein
MRIHHVVASLLISASLAGAQAGLVGVEGTVKGFDGEPLAGATLLFLDTSNGNKYLLKTDRTGFYFGGSLWPGVYTVTIVSAEGEQLWRRHNIQVVMGGRGATAFLNKFSIDLAAARAQAEKDGRSLIDPAQFSSAKAAQQAALAAERLRDIHVLAKLTAAEVAEKNGDFILGEKFLQEAIAMRQDAGSLWARLALLRIRAANALDPAGPEAVNWYESSLAASAKALALEPKTGSYLNNKAEALGRLHRIDEALQTYAEAIATNDGDAALYYSNRALTITRASLQESDQEQRRKWLMVANADFDAAIKLDPTLTDALFQKAVNQLAFVDPSSGKVPNAKGTLEILQRYLTLAPRGKHATEAKDLIAQLKK